MDWGERAFDLFPPWSFWVGKYFNWIHLGSNRRSIADSRRKTSLFALLTAWRFLGGAVGKGLRKVINILLCFIFKGEFLLKIWIFSRRLYGGYSFLKYGTVGRALQDLTGAVVQSVPPSLPLLSGSVPRSTILVAITDTVSDILLFLCKIQFEEFGLETFYLISGKFFLCLNSFKYWEI